MNMKQTLLEGRIGSADADKNLSELATYVFPIENAESYVIQERLNPSDLNAQPQPVNFVWAATHYKDGDNDSQKKFLTDLAKSILPSRKSDTSLFFATQDSNVMREYMRRFRLASRMKGGPEVFEKFKTLVGSPVSKIGLNTFTRSADAEGNPYTLNTGTEGLEDAYGQYYTKLERKLELNYQWLRGESDDDDVLLYAAYLKYIFDVLNNALIVNVDSNGSTVDLVKECEKERQAAKKKGVNDGFSNATEAALYKLMKSGAKNVEYYLTGKMVRHSVGSETNYGSVYNKGVNQLKEVSPYDMDPADVSEYRVYPQYVIDILNIERLELDKLKEILKNSGKYDDVCQALDAVTSSEDNPNGGTNPADNKVLPLKVTRLVEMLKDKAIVDECVARIPGIFDKRGGSNWVDGVSKGSLDNLLTSRPQMTQADLRDTRIVGVAMGPSLKGSKTRREYTGDGIVNQGHADMIIGKAKAVKIKSASDLVKVKDDNLRKEIEKALKYKGQETCIQFTTVDGKSHEFAVTPGVDERLDNCNLENVIARKVSATDRTHVYVLSIPRGIAFAAMQNDEGEISRVENAGTLCRNLKVNGDDKTYNSVEDLMESPIGKYCRAVTRYRKVGRIRFGNDEANQFYRDILDALKNMKSASQSFNPRVVDGKTAIKAILSIMAGSSLGAEKVFASLTQMFKSPMEKEEYNKKIGEFVFRRISDKHVQKKPELVAWHLIGMYNLDSIKGFADARDVQLILDGVVPNVWGFAGWNYGNVLKAAAAWDEGEYEPAGDVYDDGPSDDGSDMFEPDDVYNQFGKTTYGDAYNQFEKGSYDDVEGVSHDDDDGVSYDNAMNTLVGDIGSHFSDKASDIYDSVMKRLFKTKLDLAKKANRNPSFNEADTRRLKDGLINVFNAKRDDFPVDLARVVENIPTGKFDTFRKSYDNAIYKALANAPDDTDNSLRVGMLLDDDVDINWALSNTAELLTQKVSKDKAYDDTDRAIIPAMGALMARVAIEKGREDNEQDARFDSKYLASAFNQKFEEKFASADAAVKKGMEAVQSGTPMTSMMKARLNKAIRNKNTYKAIRDKIDSNPNYVNNVATLVADLGPEIRGIGANKSYTSTEQFVPFDKATMSSDEQYAGQTLVKFCTYAIENDTDSAVGNNLATAFANEGVYYMMDKLLDTVPSECLSVDYDADIYGYANADVKSPEKLFQNECQILKSYCNDAKNNYSLYQGGISMIYSIYKNGSIKGMFTSVRGSAYKYNGEDIDLDIVETFFTQLMQIAESYNTRKQRIIQQTKNNIRQAQKNLVNDYFVTLKRDFDAAINRMKNGQFSDQDRDLMDTVMDQVVSNPMNVLINNNHKLISAFVYYKDIAKAYRRSAFQSDPKYGVGNRTSEKSQGKEGYITGRNKVIDKVIPTLKYVKTITQSRAFVNYVRQIEKDADSPTTTQALSDYDEYRDSVASSGQSAVDVLNKCKTEDDIKYAKDDQKLFCNYKSADSTTNNEESADSTTNNEEFRVKELVLALYQTCREIADSCDGPNFRTLENLVDAISANEALFETEIPSLIDLDLIERLCELDAELQLASPDEYRKVVNLASGRKADETKEMSNSANIPTAVRHFQGKSYYSTENTEGLIKEIISDKPLDVQVLQDILTDMDKAGDAAHGSAINFNGGMLDVLDVKTYSFGQKSSMKVAVKAGKYRRQTLRLRLNDILIVLNSMGEPCMTRVISKVQNAGNQYVLDFVSGLDAGSKDVPFGRFQPGNALLGPAMERMAPKVVNAMDEWYKGYQPDDAAPQTTPKDIQEKLMLLCLLYATCPCAVEVKSLVLYYAWRASNYNYKFRPSAVGGNGISFSGAERNNKYVNRLMTTIANDLERFERGGSEEDSQLYDNIVDELPSGIKAALNRYGYDMADPEKVKSSAEATAENRKDTSLVMSTIEDMKVLVPAIGALTGFVSLDDVKKYLESEDVCDVFGYSKEQAETFSKALDNEYSRDINDILYNYNIAYAAPIVKRYKESTGNPTVDGAIDYIKTHPCNDPNTPTKDPYHHGGIFGEYVRKECMAWLKRELGII